MWTISEVKAKGREAFKTNYWRCVLVTFILTMVSGVAASSSTAGGDNGESATSEFSSAFQTLNADQQATFIGILLGMLGIGFIIGLLIRIFIKNPLEVGCYNFFKKNVLNPPADLGAVKEGFSDFGHIFITLLLRDLFNCLWLILFIVPGIVKMYSYKMVPYIIKDNPELSATEVITRSREMMNGNKWKAFLLDLSFIGWILLSIITLGIAAFFWVGPYVYSTEAALYLELKDKQ